MSQMVFGGSRKNVRRISRAVEDARDAESARIADEMSEDWTNGAIVEIDEPFRHTDWDEAYRFGKTTIVAPIRRAIEGRFVNNMFVAVRFEDWLAWRNGARFVAARKSEVDAGAIAATGFSSASHPFEYDFARHETVAWFGHVKSELV